MQSDPTGPRLPRSAPYDALVPVVDAVLAAAGHQRALYDQHGTARVSGFHLSPAWHAVLTVTHRPAPDGPADTPTPSTPTSGSTTPRWPPTRNSRRCRSP
jgi:hypothetical protein